MQRAALGTTSDEMLCGPGLTAGDYFGLEQDSKVALVMTSPRREVNGSAVEAGQTDKILNHGRLGQAGKRLSL